MQGFDTNFKSTHCSSAYILVYVSTDKSPALADIRVSAMTEAPR